MFHLKKKSKTSKVRANSDDGFTIVELMIALSILSTILVIGTVITIQVGGMYTKGVNSANLQNANRNVASDISATLQLSGTVPFPCTATTLTCYADHASQSIDGTTSEVYSYCVDGTRYTYVLNRQLGTDSSNSVNTPHILWHDKIKTGNCAVLDLSAASPTDANSDGDGYEMMPENSRLNKFKIVENPANTGLYSIEIWSAHGDSDLVNTDANGHANCVGTKGTQYCAVSELSETAMRRVQ